VSAVAETPVAEGVRTESLYPGHALLRDMTPHNRDLLFRSVPDLKHGREAAMGGPARPLVRVQEAKRIVRL